MSYLPSSRLYDRDPEPRPAPKPEPKPKTVAKPPKPVKATPTFVAPPVDLPAPAPLQPVAHPPVLAPIPPPVVAPVLPPVAPPIAHGPKEWLVAPTPVLNFNTSPSETVTSPAPGVKKTGRTRQMFDRAQKVVLRQIERAKSNQPSPAEPDLLWFAVMCLGSLCMGLMIWGAYSALPRFGQIHSPLRAEGLGRKLMVTSDVPDRWNHEPPQPIVPPLVPPVPTAPVLPVAVPQPHPQPQAPMPPWQPLPEFQAPIPAPAERPLAEPPLAPLPERKEPVIFVNANLGDTPMIRTWKKLSETSLLAAALTVASSQNLLAQLPDRPAIDYSKDIAALTKAVQTLSDQVNAFKFDEKLNAVKSELNDKITKIKLEAPNNTNEFLLLAQRLDLMEKQISNLARQPIAQAPAPAPVGPIANGNLDEIKRTLGSIEQAILKLQPTDKRIALSPPSPEAPVAKVGGSNVIFVNLYNQDLWLWINQKQHRAPAGTTLTLDNIPSGPTTIEVRSPDGIFHKSNPTLVANETFTLTAR